MVTVFGIGLTQTLPGTRVATPVGQMFGETSVKLNVCMGSNPAVAATSAALQLAGP